MPYIYRSLKHFNTPSGLCGSVYSRVNLLTAGCRQAKESICSAGCHTSTSRGAMRTLGGPSIKPLLFVKQGWGTICLERDQCHQPRICTLQRTCNTHTHMRARLSGTVQVGAANPPVCYVLSTATPVTVGVRLSDMRYMWGYLSGTPQSVTTTTQPLMHHAGMMLHNRTCSSCSCKT